MRYLFGLQYLRAIAALAVVCFHAAGVVHLNFNSGQAGVDLFFVLSGFLMWSITEKPGGRWAFLAGRIKRIVPVYWIATIVVLIGALLNLFPAIVLTSTHVLSSLLFIPAISPSNGYTWPLLVPGWTLNYEMFFYLIFFLSLFLSRALQLIAMMVVLVGLVASRAVIHYELSAMIFYSDPIILEFIAGASIAPIIAQVSPRLETAKLGFALFVFALLWLAGADFYGRLPRIIAWGIPASMLITGTVLIERSNFLPRLWILSFIGDASFSIYVWHTLAISLSRKILAPLNLPVAPYFTVLLVSGVCAGLFLYLAIERPILRYLSVSFPHVPRSISAEAN